MLKCPKCNNQVEDNLAFCPRCGAELNPGRGTGTHVGTIIQKNFAVKELLGEGGMGKVYLAEQLSLKKPVAIKILKKEFAHGEVYARRFEREALAASRLHHPNSIQIIEFGRAESGELFLVMEYLRGTDLAVLMARDFPFPIERTVDIASQVTSALVEAHTQGVIHRDLKPENIMVERTRDGRDFVKVLDFGLAQITAPGAPRQQERLTDTGMICGTPEYMSPEQARGEKLDSRSDIYSLGVIIYQMLTGKLPFEAPNPIDIVTRHLQERPTPPRRLRPDLNIPKTMERICLKCLQKRRGDRYQNAEALFEKLEDYSTSLKLPKMAKRMEEIEEEVSNSGMSVPPIVMGKGEAVSGEMLKLRKELFDMPSNENTADSISPIGMESAMPVPPAAAELDLGIEVEPLDLQIERTAPPVSPQARVKPPDTHAQKPRPAAMNENEPGALLPGPGPALRLAREPRILPARQASVERHVNAPKQAKGKGGVIFFIVFVLVLAGLGVGGYHYYPRIAEKIGLNAGKSVRGNSRRGMEPALPALSGQGKRAEGTRRLKERKTSSAQMNSDNVPRINGNDKKNAQLVEVGKTRSIDNKREPDQAAARAGLNEKEAGKENNNGKNKSGGAGPLAALMKELPHVEHSSKVSYNRPLEDKNAIRLYKIARRYISSGKYDEAISGLKKVIWVEKYFAPARRDLAIALLKRGLKENAAREFRNYLRIEPQAKDAKEVRQLLKNCAEPDLNPE
ncbi:MAG: protein kinase [Deltaproteobacteria bacterium]|nr:protein kinase [Deltaproteobacteria bacterium]